MPRFTICHHQMPDAAQRPSHWDLMLQQGPSLATWALEQPPAPDRSIAARRLADHRAIYLDYEGLVAGGRGTVARWDTGHYETLHQSSDHWIVRLHGLRCCDWQLDLRQVRDDVWTVSVAARTPQHPYHDSLRCEPS